MASGNFWLILCCGCYLIWWAIAFHPHKTFSLGPKVVLFLITLGLGIVGVTLTIMAIASTPAELLPCPIWLIVIIAVAAYVLLLFGSARFLHRQVTTELALIVGWCGLECALIECLGAVGLLSNEGVIIAGVVTVACAIAGLACYLAYYRLQPMPAYYVAMIPLVLCAFAMGLVCVL